MIIAIDGPSASGKGTLARKLAAHFGLPCLDTGALYRMVALALHPHVASILDALDPENRERAISIAAGFRKKIDFALLQNPALRSDDIGQLASLVSPIPEVRAQLLDLQKEFAHQPGGAVLDGRDIGTIIAPDANVKIFVVASAEKRAERRLKELQSAGQKVTYEAVLKDMVARDARDAARTIAPTMAAEDAVMLDTSLIDADQAFAAALEIVESKVRVF